MSKKKTEKPIKKTKKTIPPNEFQHGEYLKQEKYNNVTDNGKNINNNQILNNNTNNNNIIENNYSIIDKPINQENSRK